MISPAHLYQHLMYLSEQLRRRLQKGWCCHPTPQPTHRSTFINNERNKLHELKCIVPLVCWTFGIASMKNWKNLNITLPNQVKYCIYKYFIMWTSRPTSWSKVQTCSDSLLRPNLLIFKVIIKDSSCQKYKNIFPYSVFVPFHQFLALMDRKTDNQL